ncbi:MAG: serine/threonine protein kinase [Myxococcales bacterium]|nr:MAG: serine/threonine protein kinase [Myxococcales bacterium]
MRDRDAKIGSPAGSAPLASSRGWAGAVGQTIGGRYRLSTPLGRGGMGEVWRAEHLVTGRQVALKLLSKSLSQHREMRRRFLREARAVAKVNHPNVIEVLDAFDDNGLLALVMPVLEGEVLGSFLQRRGALSVTAALEIFLPLVSAVDAAHAQGIVHRDLKPDNVFIVSERGRRHVKVLDFGIAKLMNPASADSASLTAAGSPIGTLWYMAPEQCLADSTQDHLVDVWALGVILYELLSGRRPIEGQNLAQVLRASVLKPIKPLHELAPGIPRDISKLTLQMLSYEKAARPQNLREVYERLLAYVPKHQQRDWQRARHDDTRTSASAPPGSEEPTLGHASTVRVSPTDHAMLSSVRPPASSRSRQAWLGAAAIAATALVVVIAKRSAPVESPGAVVAARPSSQLTTAPGSPPASAPRQAPEEAAPLAQPLNSALAAQAPRSGPARANPVALRAAPAASSAEAKPLALPAEVPPRPLDKTNPFLTSPPSAAKRSFAH